MGSVTLSVAEAIRSAAIRAVILRERWQSGVAYDPLSARAARDPYPAYAALRARAPVHRSRLLRGLVFTRHADVGAILRDHRHFANDPRKGTLSSRHLAMLPPPHDYTLLFLDPPDHTRLRALISKAFTPRVVNAYESRIRGIVEALVDGLDDPAGFDLMRAVARPLPAIVIAEMLGVPVEDRARFRVWARRRARLLEPTIGPRERKAGARALQAFDAYFRPVMEERRTAPGDDIVSGLVRALDESARLSERETLNMLRLLVGAGTETTADLIGNGILALLRSPDQLQRLREDPALITGAVNELLRFDPPVQTVFRRAVADCEVNGYPVPKRENIALVIGAANHDPEVFERPDRLDVGRRPGPHLSFGRGIHRCPGASLALLQGRIVLEVLLKRFSSIGLGGDRPRFHRGIVRRSLRSLALRCVKS